VDLLCPVMLNSLGLYAATDVVQYLQGVVVPVLSTKRGEVARIDIAHLNKKLTFDTGGGCVRHHAVHKRNVFRYSVSDSLDCPILPTISALMARLRGTR
jgi:hypothetical protein